MNTRRSFVKSGLIAGLAATVLPATGHASSFSTAAVSRKKWKHWVWTNPDPKDQEETLHVLYQKYYEAGIRGIFFEADSEKHFRAARAQRLEAHRWIWTMNRKIDTLMKSHPEWYAVNRKGENCVQHPPYVDYYRWLCPSRPEVQQYLENEVEQILSEDYVDGVHLDYVRYCDIILPVNLWENYKIEQTRELPEYDYCYCEVCRAKFQEFRGQVLEEIVYPEASLSWRQYRYNAITGIVNKLAAVAGRHKKQLTAAVFPTPEVARRNVRQDWTNWNLNGVCPMIYHGFYKEPVEWIGDAVSEGVHFLAGKFPLYAGLYLSDFHSIAAFRQGVQYALEHGAAGVSLFGHVTDEVLEAVRSVSAAHPH